MPSDPKGLAQIVKDLRKKDPSALLAYEADQAQQREIAEDVVYITTALSDEYLSFDSRLDAFLRCCVDVEATITETTFKGRATFERVVVGAPVWVREETSLPLPGTKT